MKAGIHPDYVDAKIQCVCGNIIETRSTQELIKVDICSACHPFFTGRQKLVDTAGRIDRFRRKYAKLQDKGTAEAPETSEETQEASS